ncbi:MAG: hypothetical protein ACYCRE_05055 [Acidobacteriaceae bacterium]
MLLKAGEQTPNCKFYSHTGPFCPLAGTKYTVPVLSMKFTDIARKQSNTAQNSTCHLDAGIGAGVS